MAVDFISAISEAAGKLFDLIRLSLPSDAVRLQRFKDREPKRYQRMRMRMEDQLYAKIKKEYKNPSAADIDQFVCFCDYDLPDAEIESLTAVMIARFGIKNLSLNTQ